MTPHAAELNVSQVPVPSGTILLAYRGSVAHNMYVPGTDPNSIDDVDLIGICVAPVECYLGLEKWGSRGTQQHVEGRFDCVFYEVRKAIELLLAGNPNIMSLLWLLPEHYLRLTDAGKLLIENRSIFVGKHVFESFAGYAQAQLEKMESRDPEELREYIGLTEEAKIRGIHPNKERLPEPEGPRPYRHWSDDKIVQRLRSYMRKGENIGYLGDKRKKLVLQHGYDAKNAAHCVRLLRMCREFLASGQMQVFRTVDAPELLDIKRGKWPLDDVKRLANDLFQEIRTAYERSTLREGPDRAAAGQLCVRLVADTLGLHA